MNDPKKLSILAAVLGIGIIALIISQVMMMNQLESLRGSVASVQAENQQSQRWVTTEVSKLRENIAAENQKTIATLTAEVDQAKKTASQAIGRARSEVAKSSQAWERKLVAETKAQSDKAEEIASQINAVKQESETKFTGVANDVNAVRTEVASTKSDLEKTSTELKKVVGDMGVMSGLIATNSKEINGLRSLGERNYYEFTLYKNKKALNVSNVALTLKKTDAKDGRFTLDVVADDRKIEKKNRGVNEPVQFYMAKGRFPYELVVNEVHKDRVVGYLSTPKVQMNRGASE